MPIDTFCSYFNWGCKTLHLQLQQIYILKFQLINVFEWILVLFMIFVWLFFEKRWWAYWITKNFKPSKNHNFCSFFNLMFFYYILFDSIIFRLCINYSFLNFFVNCNSKILHYGFYIWKLLWKYEFNFK